MGIGYRGHKSRTRSGESCKSWESQGYRQSDFYTGESASQVRNYCRATTRSNNKPGGPWCFTDKGAAELCEVPSCGEYEMGFREFTVHVLSKIAI